VTHIYIKPSSNQRSTTSRVASAAGRLRPNAETGKVKCHFKCTVTRLTIQVQFLLPDLSRRTRS
jgi:hypothetical protein